LNKYKLSYGTKCLIKASLKPIENGFERNRKRISSSGILRRVALAGTEVSEESIASNFRVTKIGKLGLTLALTSN
jgi:hypothetical protein